MKRSMALFISFTIIGIYCLAQESPVRWSYTVKKLSDKQYEISLTASIQHPWHIYSQNTPDGGPVPTKIVFNKNPLIEDEGKTQESGKLVTKHEDVFGVDVKYYDNNVSFVQKLNVKSNIKTNISGTAGFMVCNDVQCLPPAKVPFTVVLN